MSFLNNIAKTGERSTILITGGATGLGLHLAKELLALGHVVIAAGRRQEMLDAAVKQNPGLHAIQFDISTDEGRIALHQTVMKDFPDVNVLINNAGYANWGTMPLHQSTPDDWETNKKVMATNLDAPIHLCILFLPSFTTKTNAMVINVTDCGAFYPMLITPVYSATKAALHSVTLSLREHVRNTPVQVVEIIPYILATPASHPAFHGVDLTVFAKHCLQKIFEGVVEVGYESDHIIRGSRDALDAQFVRYNDKVERILGDTIRGMQSERKKQKV